jgi:putative ABC transport system permease protein
VSRRECRGPVGLLARQSAGDAPLISLVALVVAMAAFLVTAAPAALASVASQELRHTLSDFPAVRRDLTASGFFGYPSAGGGRSTGEGLAAISDTIERAPASLGPPLTSLLDSPEWVATTDRDEVQVIGSKPGVVGRELGLAVSPDWLAHVEITDGRAPTAWTGDDDDLESGASASPVEIVVSRDAAEQMGIAIGDLLAFDIAPLRVTGLYQPADAERDFWQHQPQLAAPIERRADDGRKLLVADAFVDPGSTAGLSDSFAEARLQAWYPLRTTRFGFDDASNVARQVRELSATGAVFPSGEFLMFSSILASDLDAIRQRVALATSLMVLLIAGPIGVVLAVLALAARAIAQRRAATFTLARVRGAGGAGLRLAMLLEGLIIAVPAAALGAGAAVALTIATGGQPDSGTVVAGAVIVIAALPLLFAAAVPRPARVDGTPAAGWRWVGELVVVGLAAASVFLLVRGGVVGSDDGPDLLLAAAPLLVAAAGTFGVLRVYPLLMRAAQRSSRRGRGAVALVGTARATYAPTLGFATAFALIVGISVAVFSLGAASSLALALTRTDAATRREIPPLDAGHPLVGAVFALLWTAVAITLVLCLVAVVLGVLSSSRQRDGVVGILRVLGFSPAQLRGVVAWELTPVALVAIIAGVVLGIVEVIVVVTAIDLPSLVGADSSGPRLDPLATTALVALTAAAVAVTALAASAIARRRSPAASLRMGME